ncbi:hypothetical protein [Paraburkholderia hospita]|jgi:hypothetical protein|uniref:hypothetical protein n=1 Tax=Paraburkholderia hospita TaxID=169430 RepID=UPI00103DFF11|nr:hypothetical protein [Paraburkholderia hospita]
MSLLSPAGCVPADPHLARAANPYPDARGLPYVAESVSNVFTALNRELFINQSNKTNKAFNGSVKTPGAGIKSPFTLLLAETGC